tara:strand:- start:1289 stop:1531 length:243 start_codon:yes stop_codon:yes gene_type:complete
MKNPSSFQDAPYKVKVEKDKTYFWCSCGLSKKQPFCDGSHKKETYLKPVKYLAKTDKEVWLCGCKRTKHQPFCDGSHSKI